jgi:uncharacterized protein YfcZ (UPF0381/DUF406 family)
VKYIITKKDECKAVDGYIFETKEKAEKHLEKIRKIALNKSHLSNYQELLEKIEELTIREDKDEK